VDLLIVKLTLNLQFIIITFLGILIWKKDFEDNLRIVITIKNVDFPMLYVCYIQQYLYQLLAFLFIWKE